MEDSRASLSRSLERARAQGARLPELRAAVELGEVELVGRLSASLEGAEGMAEMQAAQALLRGKKAS